MKLGTNSKMKTAPDSVQIEILMLFMHRLKLLIMKFLNQQLSTRKLYRFSKTLEGKIPRGGCYIKMPRRH